MLRDPQSKQSIMDKFIAIDKRLAKLRADLHPKPKLRVIQGGKQDGKRA